MSKTGQLPTAFVGGGQQDPVADVGWWLQHGPLPAPSSPVKKVGFGCSVGSEVLALDLLMGRRA
ncbi:hypothetical protein N9917_00370 [Deltaproteobacteria bacterium]|nr:hypothetical protein [Deltaproteobacteria bacterium]